MYAVIEVGSKQYTVKEGDVLDVEKQAGAKGESVTLDKVLLISADDVQVGQPYVAGASVLATVVDDKAKGEKLISFKYRRRKNSHWKKGHRQQLTKIKIEKIKI